MPILLALDFRLMNCNRYSFVTFICERFGDNLLDLNLIFLCMYHHLLKPLKLPAIYTVMLQVPVSDFTLFFNSLFVIYT